MYINLKADLEDHGKYNVLYLIESKIAFAKDNFATQFVLLYDNTSYIIYILLVKKF